jgi:hypothetical protein
VTIEERRCSYRRNPNPNLTSSTLLTSPDPYGESSVVSSMPRTVLLVVSRPKHQSRANKPERKRLGKRTCAFAGLPARSFRLPLPHCYLVLGLVYASFVNDHFLSIFFFSPPFSIWSQLYAIVPSHVSNAAYISTTCCTVWAMRSTK